MVKGRKGMKGWEEVMVGIWKEKEVEDMKLRGRKDRVGLGINGN